MDSEWSQLDNRIEVLSDERSMGELLGSARGSIACTNKTHTPAPVLSRVSRNRMIVSSGRKS